MTGRRVAGLASLTLATACATTGGSLGAPSAFGSRREERVLVSSFSNIVAIAASQRSVFVASPEAIAIYDRQFGAWQPPLAMRSPLFGGTLPIMAADPIEEGVWIATPGTVRFFRTGFDAATDAIVPGTPDALMFDRRNFVSGAYVHSGGQWLLVSRTGAALPVTPAMLPPPGSRQFATSLRDVFERYPSVRGFMGLLTRDESLQTWPVSAGTLVADANEVWLGTRGGGVFKVDPLFNTSQHVAYGLIERGVGAIALTADGVVVAGLGADGARGGLTVASADLQHFRWIEGSQARTFAGARAHDIAVRGDAIWVATDRGLIRADLRRPADARVWSAGNGLPTDQALSVAASATGVWVGTARGVAFVTDSGSRATRDAASDVIAGGAPTRALLLTGDTLWIGSERGLLLLRAASADSAPRRVALAADEPRLTRPIVALARSDSVVLVATEGDLMLIDPRAGRVLPRLDAVGASALRGITCAAIDAHSIWLGGRGGLLVIDRASGVHRLLADESGIAGEVFALRLDPAFAWIGTRDGLVRIRRTSGGLAP
ncbi:MAG: hypothetical protein M3081_16735 [Gemmatimonadota bacterium]|nr:hypothetical protein [Gemmatimonadota bacterium]